jgi:hypothetical protein
LPIVQFASFGGVSFRRDLTFDSQSQQRSTKEDPKLKPETALNLGRPPFSKLPKAQTHADLS